MCVCVRLSSPPDVAVRMASAGYLIFGIDYENHGCSEGLHGYIPRFDALAEDVVAFCDQLRGEVR